MGRTKEGVMTLPATFSNRDGSTMSITRLDKTNKKPEINDSDDGIHFFCSNSQRVPFFGMYPPKWL